MQLRARAFTKLSTTTLMLPRVYKPDVVAWSRRYQLVGMGATEARQLPPFCAQFKPVIATAAPSSESTASDHWNSSSLFSSRTVVSAEANLHISAGLLPTASHKVLKSLPRPQFSAVAMLLGSMNGARAGQTLCAVSKKTSTPTFPIPLISSTSLRIFAGEESARVRILFKSPSERNLSLASVI